MNFQASGDPPGAFFLEPAQFLGSHSAFLSMNFAQVCFDLGGCSPYTSFALNDPMMYPGEGSGMAKKSMTERLVRRVFYKYFARNMLYELQMRARSDSADYVQDFMGEAVILEDHDDLLRHAVAQAPEDGLILEFGVAGGTSINVIADATPKTIYGFDSFEGLPWAWGGALELTGAFSKKGAEPKVRSNVELVKGLFSETIPSFAAAHGEPIALLHVDCDLYRSTVDILDGLGDRLRPGSVILFDEYLNYPGWRHHEYKAWQEFVKSHSVTYEYLAFSARDGQALVKITNIKI